MYIAVVSLSIIQWCSCTHCRYGCDLCFTPMIVADSFVQSVKARDNEFTTNNSEDLSQSSYVRVPMFVSLR